MANKSVECKHSGRKVSVIHFYNSSRNKEMQTLDCSRRSNSTIRKQIRDEYISEFIYYRYMIDDNRAIFMFKDGSQAWEAKDFLLQQDRCESVSLENKVYPGKGSPNFGKDEL